MATPRFAWGIDIGNRALKAVKLVPSADGLVIDDFDVVEHDTVLSASGDNRDSLIQTALSTFVERHPGIEKGQVGVSVNGQRTFAKFIKLPPVEPKELPKIVRFEAVQQIPFPLDDVEWAYHLFQDPEAPDVEVGIFAMRKELVNGHIKFFTDANLNVQVVQMSPLSVYNAMYYDSRIKGTTMIVDLGAENTDLIIAEGEGVWLRSIPIGGNNFTEALTKSFKVDFDKAEELKRNAATSRYSRQIVQAMRPIFADLVSEIQRSMGFYGSTHKESKIGRVIALGNTFRLPGLERYLQQNLSLEVKSLHSLGSGTMEDARLAGLFNENLLSSAGAYGLALQVMGQGKIASSLLPERIRREKMWREKNKWFAAAAALFIAGAATAYGSYYLSSTQLQSADAVDDHDKITKVEHDAKLLDTDWSQIESAGGGDLQKIKNVQALTEDRGVWPQINALLVQKLPQYGPDVPAGFATGDLTVIKQVPRRERKQIVLSAYTSKYGDLTAALAGGEQALAQLADPAVDAAAPTGGGNDLAGTAAAGLSGAAAATPGTPAAAPKRGYILTLRCTTPNAANAAVFVKYMSDLKDSPPTAERPWKVSAGTIVRQVTLGNDPARMTAMAAAYQLAQTEKMKGTQSDAQGTGAGLVLPGALHGTAPGGVPPGGVPGGLPGMVPGAMPPAMPGGMPGQPFDPSAGEARGGGLGVGIGGGGQSTAVPDDAYNDPVLGEDVRTDTEAVIVLAVELNAAPPAAPNAKAVAAAQ